MDRLMPRLFKPLLALVLASAAFPASAVSIPQTFVSTTGTDSNPCTAAQPCQTFTSALSKTDSNGEIVCLGPGDYGAVNITQNVTIDGEGAQSSVIVNTGANAIVVIGANVILRHLSLNGAGSSGQGIVCDSGNLTVEDCRISGFGGGGMNLFLTGGGNVVVKNTSIVNSGVGIRVNSGAGTPGVASFRDVTIQGAQTYGLFVQAGSVDISNSLITQTNGIAVESEGSGAINCLGCTLTNNGTAVRSYVGALIRLSNNDIFNNGIGIDPNGGGKVSSAGNNRKAGNTTPGAPTPNAVIVAQ